jgi:hypothetical protein
MEQFILLLVFLAVALVQYLLRGAGQHNGGEPEQATNKAPTAHQPLEPAPPPVAADQTLADTNVMRKRIAAVPLTPQRAARRRPSPRQTAIMGLRKPFELRRSIVLMTVLGRCRAMDPHDWPKA